jgi:hypothetical protein
MEPSPAAEELGAMLRVAADFASYPGNAPFPSSPRIWADEVIAQVVSASAGVMLDSDRDNGSDHFSVEVAALET